MLQLALTARAGAARHGAAQWAVRGAHRRQLRNRLVAALRGAHVELLHSPLQRLGDVHAALGGIVLVVVVVIVVVVVATLGWRAEVEGEAASTTGRRRRTEQVAHRRLPAARCLVGRAEGEGCLGCLRTSLHGSWRRKREAALLRAALAALADRHLVGFHHGILGDTLQDGVRLAGELVLRQEVSAAVLLQVCEDHLLGHGIGGRLGGGPRRRRRHAGLSAAAAVQAGTKNSGREGS